MGWLFASGFVVIAVALLWRFGALPREGLHLVLAAALIGLSGYAWQSHPNLRAAPVVPSDAIVAEDTRAIETRHMMSGRFNADAQWLDFSEAMLRLGATRQAVTAARSGLAHHRNSPDLWVGLGNALVAHAGGLVTPAAEFAYRHAAQLSPEHPGPPFFYALALARSGRTDEAGFIWRGMLARTPPDAPWRADLVERLSDIEDMPVTKPGDGGNRLIQR